MRRDRMSPVNTSATAVVSELEALSIVPHLTAVQDDRGGRHGNDTPARSRLAHGTTLILLTMSLGVLIAQSTRRSSILPSRRSAPGSAPA
jgi:hypothetical protein